MTWLQEVSNVLVFSQETISDDCTKKWWNVTESDKKVKHSCGSITGETKPVSEIKDEYSCNKDIYRSYVLRVTHTHTYTCVHTHKLKGTVQFHFRSSVLLQICSFKL